jgi:hypothetical protein
MPRVLRSIVMPALAAGLTLCPFLLTCGAQYAFDPLPMWETAPGVFVHIGAVAVMTQDNEGDVAATRAPRGSSITNVGFVIGGDAVAVIDHRG